MKERRRTIDVQGARIPRLGFGTWPLRGDECRAAVETALEVGYRHIDTAQAYENEGAVGAAIRSAGVPRRELFVATKIHRDHSEPEAVRKTVHESLGRLGLAYVDLLMVHWPSDAVAPESTLEAMLELRNEGVARHLGVSNFTPTLLREALRIAPILANQVEHHPYLDQPELREMCRDHELALIAYSPLARGRVHDDATLRRLAERRGTTPAALALRFLMERDHVAVIPSSSKPVHIRSNFTALDLELDDEVVRRLRSLARGERHYDPSFAPAWERA